MPELSLPELEAAAQAIAQGMGLPWPPTKHGHLCRDAARAAIAAYLRVAVENRDASEPCQLCGFRVRQVDPTPFALDEEERPVMTDQEKLLALAGWLIGDLDWNDIDGSDRQDALIKHGLAVETIATEADVGDDSDYEVGDTFCRLTELGKAARAAWRASKK